MSFLTVINDTCDVINLDRFDTVYGNDDPNALVLVTLAQEGGKEIARRVDWARMLKTKTFTGASTALPDDFQRLVPGSAVHNAAGVFARPCLNSGQWAIIRNGSAQRYYFVSGTDLQVSPAFTDETTIEYVSDRWVRSSGGEEKTTFGADDDTMQFPERLMTLDLIWRWRRRGGLSFDDQNGEFEAALVQEIQANRGAA